MRASALSQRQKRTSLCTFGCEFGTTETSFLLSISGIRAAAENARRISTAKDGGDSRQQQVCETNLQLKNVHQLKIVQMVSQPHYSAIFIYVLSTVIPRRLK